MIFWLTWPIEWIAQLFVSERAKKVEKKIEQSIADPGYLTAKEWATIHGISKEKAAQQLEAAVTAGALERMYLYRGPIDFVVPESRLDKEVRPEELGLSEDDQPIVVSKFKVETVYVAPGDVNRSLPTRHAA